MAITNPATATANNPTSVMVVLMGRASRTRQLDPTSGRTAGGVHDMALRPPNSQPATISQSSAQWRWLVTSAGDRYRVRIPSFAASHRWFTLAEPRWSAWVAAVGRRYQGVSAGPVAARSWRTRSALDHHHGSGESRQRRDAVERRPVDHPPGCVPRGAANGQNGHAGRRDAHKRTTQPEAVGRPVAEEQPGTRNGCDGHPLLLTSAVVTITANRDDKQRPSARPRRPWPRRHREETPPRDDWQPPRPDLSPRGPTPPKAARSVTAPTKR